MYDIFIWDPTLAANEGDGAIARGKISHDLALFFFNLAPQHFPLLSQLSFDDFDLFSADQLDCLNAELLEAAKIIPEALGEINSILNIVKRAKALKKAILFDPFHRE